MAGMRLMGGWWFKAECVADAGCPVRCTQSRRSSCSHAVVGHDPVDANAQAGIVSHRLAQELGATQHSLVGQDTGKGHPRVIVDRQVHSVPADTTIVIERAVARDAVAHAWMRPRRLVSTCSSPGAART